MKVKYHQLSNKNWLKEQLQIKSLRRIAKEIGCHNSTILYAVKKYGLKIPKRNSYFGWVNRETKIEASKKAYKKKYPKGRFGKLAANWKGGRRIANKAGYVYIYNPNHPSATKEGYVMEHRLVMEKKIGRFLKKNEIVHHINGDTKDNRIENLELMGSKKEHSRKHFDAIKEVARLKEILKEHGISYD